MDPKTSPWQKRFELTTCSASEIATAVPPTALGVAVIYAPSDSGETIYLVLESRAGNLRDFCLRRLQNAKIPAGTPLTVSFKTMALADNSPEAVSAVCREQVILAGELRRELRPAMR
ncbi:hypothetical protein [Rariglobus hedericola]|uniref:Uncharacterized protein n=1 Tax=Rariglobus hedericola TaxID=2597822 RepID=A0A556QN35_9BACT|nr:hypothetical protein [Rariglobus hedericola]TSJ78037.1 hypothetical protein FPL22_01630 [Rariglobus hedericola]